MSGPVILGLPVEETILGWFYRISVLYFKKRIEIFLVK